MAKPIDFLPLRRLLYLAKEKLSFKSGHFDMGIWFRHKGKGHVHVNKKTGIPKHGCGTTACLLGGALLDPKFRELTGLTLAKDYSGGWVPVNAENRQEVNRSSDLAAVFGISKDEAMTLFFSGLDNPYQKRKQVVKKIERVLKDNGATI